jgi:hypothetical protein
MAYGGGSTTPKLVFLFLFGLVGVAELTLWAMRGFWPLPKFLGVLQPPYFSQKATPPFFFFFFFKKNLRFYFFFFFFFFFFFVYVKLFFVFVFLVFNFYLGIGHVSVS